MSGLCGRDCRVCTLEDQCGGCSLCEVALCDVHCDRCFSLCPKRDYAFCYFQSLNNESSGDLRANDNYALPLHIPILPDRMKMRPDYDLLPVIAVHGGNMFSRNGSRINPSYSQHGFQKALNVDPRTKAILEFYVKDRTLEGFWDNRKEIYPVLKKMDFSAVISPNFSVYEDTPRLDHQYNIKRNMIVYNELQEHGIPAIPDISWFNRNDIERWSRVIVDHSIKTIAFSFQVVDIALKASNIWKSYLMGFRYLCEGIPRDVSIVIAGLVSKPKVRALYQTAAGQSLHILNQSAYVQSRRGVLSGSRSRDLESPFDTLFFQNLEYYQKTYEECVVRKEEGICPNQELQEI